MTVENLITNSTSDGQIQVLSYDLTRVTSEDHRALVMAHEAIITQLSIILNLEANQFLSELKKQPDETRKVYYQLMEIDTPANRLPRKAELEAGIKTLEQLLKRHADILTSLKKVTEPEWDDIDVDIE